MAFKMKSAASSLLAGIFTCCCMLVWQAKADTLFYNSSMIPNEKSCYQCLSDADNEVCIDSWDTQQATCCDTKSLNMSDPFDEPHQSDFK